MKPSPLKIDLLVIGGSAGSLSVVLKLVAYLKELPLSVILVTHRKSSEDETLLEVLRTRTTFRVKEAEDKDEPAKGTLYVAPADYHLLLEQDYSITLDDSEKINYSRPSIDATFETAARVYKDRLACLLLSGANADGVMGLKTAKALGATVIVQDPSTAEVSYMPQRALDELVPDFILNPSAIPAFYALF